MDPNKYKLTRSGNCIHSKLLHHDVAHHGEAGQNSISETTLERSQCNFSVSTFLNFHLWIVILHSDHTTATDSSMTSHGFPVERLHCERIHNTHLF